MYFFEENQRWCHHCLVVSSPQCRQWDSRYGLYTVNHPVFGEHERHVWSTWRRPQEKCFTTHSSTWYSKVDPGCIYLLPCGISQSFPATRTAYLPVSCGGRIEETPKSQWILSSRIFLQYDDDQWCQIEPISTDLVSAVWNGFLNMFCHVLSFFSETQPFWCPSRLLTAFQGQLELFIERSCRQGDRPFSHEKLTKSSSFLQHNVNWSICWPQIASMCAK